MKLSGWGRYPVIDCDNKLIRQSGELGQYLHYAPSNQNIARGLARSYGDSSLAAHTLTMTGMDQLIAFDEVNGVLTCMAGASLTDILKVFIPKGWFLPVTPGTQFITVGGAIASDVHGKNHHRHGCFTDHLVAFELCLASGEIVTCSTSENRELFQATCGGMGLTGIIQRASFKLLKIESSDMDETVIKTHNLNDTLEKFDEYDSTTYSVAWIDCLASGNRLGRSIITLGEHATGTTLKYNSGGNLNIPINLPSTTLNSLSIRAFNSLYYAKARNGRRLMNYASFFYPLDGIKNWNRMYGKNGFIQYQFVIPKSAGHDGLSEILGQIADSRRASFLAVLKVFGQRNNNYLSFPISGYTLALDFKFDPGLLDFLEHLDSIVLHYGGRLYLTKDSRMSENTFKKSYPQWEIFQQIRHRYDAHTRFNSIQSQRLGL